jgi:hypothetical protein
LEKNAVIKIIVSKIFYFIEIGDFACSKCSTTGTWLDFKTQWEHLRTRFNYFYYFLHLIRCFFHRTNCPKATTPTNLLSDKERNIWEQSLTIQENDKELIEAILTRYGFTEVKFIIESLLY